MQLEHLAGHDRWLDPPSEPRHHKDCPQNENNRGEDAICMCQELSDADFQDEMDRRQDADREG
jgi:hypothetical protein